MILTQKQEVRRHHRNQALGGEHLELQHVTIVRKTIVFMMNNHCVGCCCEWPAVAACHRAVAMSDRLLLRVIVLLLWVTGCCCVSSCCCCEWPAVVACHRAVAVSDRLLLRVIMLLLRVTVLLLWVTGCCCVSPCCCWISTTRFGTCDSRFEV